MDALTALHERVSVTRLEGPAPTSQQREILFHAALRAPDHAWLRPWRFLVIEDDGQRRLGDLFAKAALADSPGLDPLALERVRRKPERAPLVIVAIASHRVHPKVPTLEQDMSCAVAVGNMLIAAHAMGLGAVWRTGSMASHPVVRDGLGLGENERIVAYLYVGQPVGPLKSLPSLDVSDFFQDWPAN
ncbi:nitroreductase family protein [uncultured Halopseudomonas sp.]|uniref:nitroreductase family protein n=1 Tax=uncultured Halopseudomonas sp. TaxID=2901193 RepID=UPI0030EDEFE5|tara:strand:- start:23979 stop:24542 length:564 start_codon:yes stop_codon:yes gene_type:complete